MAFSTHDTIVAIATPPGRGGIGVVRISGAGASRIASDLITHSGPLEPRRATYSRLRGPASVTARARPAGLRVPESVRAAAGQAEVWAPAGESAHVAGAVVNDPACAPKQALIDQAIVTYFPAPHSYTGEDVVELSAHGSPVVLSAVVDAAIAGGARLAEPGEFTLRAFLNGRMDLTQAEAVGDLIDAVTPLQARAAFDQLEGTLTRAIADLDAALFDLVARLEASVDFPDEGYHFITPADAAAAIDALCSRTAALVAGARRGRLIREGLQVAIIGKPNVGKSSVFNALVGTARAIVADVPGTTRDLVTEVVDWDGLRVTLVDTAGLRESGDVVEAEGIARARQAQEVVDLLLHIIDDAACVDAAAYSGNTKYFVVQNKIDVTAARRPGAVHVSARTGEGFVELRRRIVEALLAADDRQVLRDRPEITNVRHATLMQHAHGALVRARDAARAEGGALSEEFLLADLQQARAALEEIAGRRASGDLLAHIFSRFCVGK